MPKSWKDLDAERKALPRRLSRAALARRAGISESTITKGLKNDTAPIKQVRQQVELVLDAARAMAEAGMRP